MTPERLAQIQKNHAEAQAEIDKADMLPAIVEVFQEDRASLLADVERLRILLLTANRYVEGYAENDNNHPQARDGALDLVRQIKEAT